jgi:predicted phage terminase large subunit-like protein
MLANPQAALRELDKVECADSLSAFIRRGWSQIEPSTPYKHGWHMDAICDHLQAVHDGHITRLLINVPPGTSKSLSTSVFFPAWEWGPAGKPGMRIIGTSYSERYALRDNGRTRHLVQSEWYQERWGDHVTLIKHGDKKIENTAYGFREAIPFKSLTAGRADRLIIDDPHSTESAESDTERETTIRVFLESVPTRLNDPEKSAIIIIMQRLHEEDVSGAALANDLGYTHLMLPMEYDPSRHCVTYYPGTDRVLFEDPRTEEGELLFPDRFPQKVVDNYRTGMGPFAFAGQMQQAPVPRGGGIFPWDWWQLWGDPDEPENPVFKRFPKMDYIVASLDSAYSEKSENDYSALTIWGVFKDAIPTRPNTAIGRLAQQMGGRPKIMLMDAWQKRLPLRGPEPPPRESWETDRQYIQRCQKYWGLVEWVAHSCRRFGVDRLLIESKASGISVAQEIRNLHGGEGWGVQLIDPKNMDKLARAYSVQHLFADSMVYAPDREWADLLKTQMSIFPKATHDDLTDSATQALRHIRDIGLAAHGFEIENDIAASLRHTPPSKPLYDV